MPDESLLTDEVRALEHWRSESSVVRITPRLVERACEAIVAEEWEGDLREGADAPSFILYALQAERMRHNRVRPFPRLLPASQVITSEIVVYRPLRIGEELTEQSRITGIGERFGGRYGYTLTYQSWSDFTGRDGQPAAAVVQTFIQYDPAGAQP